MSAIKLEVYYTVVCGQTCTVYLCLDISVPKIAYTSNSSPFYTSTNLIKSSFTEHTARGPAMKKSSTQIDDVYLQ